MKDTLLFLTIAAMGGAIYHIGQKLQPASLNPMVLLMVVYAIAFLASAIAAPFYQNGHPSGIAALANHWRPLLAVGLGAFLIEIGMLLAYRAGGYLQWSGIIMSAITMLLLQPIAVVFMKEHFSWSRLCGVVLTLAGMTLVVKK